jgi:hypothetical protein
MRLDGNKQMKGILGFPDYAVWMETSKGKGLLISYTPRYTKLFVQLIGNSEVSKQLVDNSMSLIRDSPHLDSSRPYISAWILPSRQLRSVFLQNWHLFILAIVTRAACGMRVTCDFGLWRGMACASLTRLPADVDIFSGASRFLHRRSSFFRISLVAWDCLWIISPARSSSLAIEMHLPLFYLLCQLMLVFPDDSYRVLKFIWRYFTHGSLCGSCL